MKFFTRIIKRAPRAIELPAPTTAPESPSNSDALPPCVAIYKIHTYDPSRGYLIMFGTPGKGKNFRLKRKHWTEARAHQVQSEICTEIGWPERFEDESQILRYVNAAREYARSRHYTIIH